MTPAMGVKGAKEIQSNLNDVKTIAKKGLNIEIKKGGKFDSPLKSKLVGPSFSVGGDYAYDYIISDLNVTTSASHEIMLLFDLNFPKKASISPRYF